MPARLFCETGELAGTAFLIDAEATIGRQRQNEIVLNLDFISGRHARIYFDDEEHRYFLEDLGSSNGTLLDGVAVTESMRLDRLHVITFAGQVDFIFQKTAKTPTEKAPQAPRNEGLKTRVGDYVGTMPPLEPTAARDPGEVTRIGDVFAPLPKLPEEATPDERVTTRVGDFFEAMPPLDLDAGADEADGTLAEAPLDVTHVGEAFPAMPPLAEADAGPGHDEAASTARPAIQPGSFVLEATLPDGTRRTFALEEGGNVVGREATCAVALPDSSISRNHALLTVRGQHVWVKDLGSKNATYVDGEKLTAEVEILPEAELSFGLSISARLRPSE